MTRVVISERYGGFGLSQAAEDRLRELGWSEKYSPEVERADARLLQVVDELGPEASSGRYAALVVVEVPDDVEWHVHEYDGFETVHEGHRCWGSDGETKDC